MKITALAAVCLSLVLISSSIRAAERPNVLFLVADDLNCDLHCYGHPQVQSPHIDRLAARGVRFEHAYCQYPLCSPSRTSFLTGRRPNVTRIFTLPRGGRFPTDYGDTPHFREYIPETVTLPQLFKENGYQIARVGKLYHYGVPGQIGTSGLDDPPSWNFVVNPAGRDKAEENKVFTLVPGNYGGTLSWLASNGTDLEMTDGLIATGAISLLEEYKDKPFFLAVGFFRPHTPYVSPRHYFDLYPTQNVTLPSLSAEDRERMPAAAYSSAKKEQENMTDDLRREAIQAYRASTSHMDAQIGRVLEALDRLDLAKNTVVVFTSDHGYHMYEHGLWQKMSLFENSARVPLIIAAPGAAGNGTPAATMAEMVDIYPTLTDLAGLKAPDYLDGVSLRKALEDPSQPVKDAAFTQLRRGNNFHGYSIRTSDYRYTLWDNGKQGEQLYDMRTDPGEHHNLANDPAHADTVKALRRRLDDYADWKITKPN